VAFRYADTDTVKFRPALVVAVPPAAPGFGIAWVLMITSARHTLWPDDVMIGDPSEAGLSRPSLVRTAKIAAIDRRHIETIGRLAAADRRLVAEHLRQHLSAALRG
jgi:mRNA interferase MazF